MKIKMLIKKYKYLTKTLDNSNSNSNSNSNNSYRDDQSQVLVSQQVKYCQPVQQLHHQPHLRRHDSTYSFMMVFGVMSMVLLSLLSGCVDAIGYSYTRFVGPVAEPERKIFLHDDTSGSGGAPQFDYAGKPEYEFAYGVEDADAHILHNRKETRDGDTVRGAYSLIDPDGTLRVVRYTADEINGFRAEVIRNGDASLHGHLPHDYVHQPSPNTHIYNHDANSIRHHYPQPAKHFNDDRVVYYKLSHKPKLEQLTPNGHETTPQPHIIHHYEKMYANDADIDGNSNYESAGDGDGDYHENQQPHYEVEEKPSDDDDDDVADVDVADVDDGDDDEADAPKIQGEPPQYEVHERPDDNDPESYAEQLYNGDENVHKSNIRIKSASHKKKKGHLHADDNDDDDDDEDNDDDYYRYDESQELDDFDEAFHAAHDSDDSEESDEFY